MSTASTPSALKGPSNFSALGEVPDHRLIGRVEVPRLPIMPASIFVHAREALGAAVRDWTCDWPRHTPDLLYLDVLTLFSS